MSTTTFDTLEFIEQLKASGVPDEQAKGHVKAFASAIRQVEESKKDELATRGDILRLEKEIEKAKVETVKWVIVTGIAILGGVAAINRIFPPVPVYYQPPLQEMRQPAQPPPALPAPPSTPAPQSVR
ncbi:MAG: hypothetical protein HQL88_11085 [Magnetococcales bacterium]|nr:hypothetical protein [Magnetococcales bacterium]